jgi:hypothetical protein
LEKIDKNKGFILLSVMIFMQVITAILASALKLSVVSYVASNDEWQYFESRRRVRAVVRRLGRRLAFDSSCFLRSEYKNGMLPCQLLIHHKVVYFGLESLLAIPTFRKDATHVAHYYRLRVLEQEGLFTFSQQAIIILPEKTVTYNKKYYPVILGIQSRY